MPLYILNHFVLLHSEVFTQLHPESIFLLSFLTWLTSLLVTSPFWMLEQNTRPQTCRLEVEVVSLTDFQPLSRNDMQNLPFHQVHTSYHPIFSPPKNRKKVSGEMTKPNSLGLHWPSRDRPDPCWTGTMSQPKMHPPLSVRLIYGFCKKDNWEVRFTKGNEFWQWFLLSVSKMILNDLNRNLEPCM